MKNFYENSSKLENGLYQFREGFKIGKYSMEKLPIREKTITESGKQYDVNSVYRFKIWKVGSKNLNERCYDFVIERILKENKTTLAFANHPNDDTGDVTKTFAVQKNPHIHEGWLCIENHFVGEFGRLAEEILEKGGEIGVSSSCIGSVDENGYIINSDDFMLERYGDWVDYPSNNYYHKKEESKISENTREKKDIEVINEVLAKELKSSDIIKAEEKNFNKAMKKYIEEVKENTSISIEDKLLEYKYLKEMFYKNEDGSIKYGENLYKKIEDEISLIKEEYKQLAEKGKQTDSILESKLKLEEKESDLKNKNEILMSLLSESKLRYKLLLETITELQKNVENKIDKDIYLKMIKIVKEKSIVEENLETENKKLQKECRILKRKLSILEKNELVRNRKDILKRKACAKMKENFELKNRERKIIQFKEELDLKKAQESLMKEDIFRQYDEVLDFYNQRVIDFPKIGEYKSEILNCKTLFEAEKKYNDLLTVLYKVETKQGHTFFDQRFEETKNFLENKDEFDDGISYVSENKYGKLY